MKYTVYIIENQNNSLYYKGYTSNLEKRLWEHNNGLSRYTRNKGPWRLVFERNFDSKSEALQFEKRIKRFNSVSLRNLIDSYNPEE